jgi:hypothetical protein
MNAVINYDVSGKHVEVKAEMIKKGYRDRWVTQSEKTYYLPNTTLYKPNTELATAKEDIQAAADKCKVTLQRAIALSASPWDGIVGTPHSP